MKNAKVFGDIYTLLETPDRFFFLRENPYCGLLSVHNLKINISNKTIKYRLKNEIKFQK